MTAERKSILQAALIAAVAYWFCLRFLFPGYFDPLFPPHPDLCIPTGLQIRPLAEIFTYPRPVSFLFLRSFGWLGVHGSILIAILTIGAGLLCLIWLVQIWTGRRASAWAIACYSVILFAQPQFYFQHRQDLSSTQSFITCLLAVEFWRRWVSDHKGWHYFAFACCLALTVLTKETYIGSLAVLLCGVLFTLEKPSLRLVSIGFAASLLIVAGCEAINWRGYKQWVLPLLGQDTYLSCNLRFTAGCKNRGWVFVPRSYLARPTYPFAATRVVMAGAQSLDCGDLAGDCRSGSPSSEQPVAESRRFTLCLECCSASICTATRTTPPLDRHCSARGAHLRLALDQSSGVSQYRRAMGGGAGRDQRTGAAIVCSNQTLGHGRVSPIGKWIERSSVAHGDTKTSCVLR